MSAHLREQDLVLHFYGEHERPAEVMAHLDACEGCRRRWNALGQVLAEVTEHDPSGAGPEWSAERAARVWARLAPRMAGEPPAPAARPAIGRRRVPGALVPLAMAASVVLAFFVGRHWPAPPSPSPMAAAPGPERVLLFAVGDHLERSEMLLVELVHANGDGPVDLEAQQQSAAELVSANRLYRQTVARSGQPGLASVLEELERLLVEVAHRPSPLAPEEAAELRRRIEGRGLLFKVRILETQVREKQKEAAPGGVVS
jgi:hypothetical protein